MAESYLELTSPIKANYPQSPWKILNRQFMQLFLFLLLSLHLLSLQLQSLFKLSFVIIKQQCKQLSQKPLLKLLEMISSVLFIWLKKEKIIFPNGGLYTLLYGFSTSSSLNWESGALGSFVWQFELTQMLNDQNFLLDWQWEVIGIVRKLPPLELSEWMKKSAQHKSQQLPNCSFHLAIFFKELVAKNKNPLN